MGGLLARGMMFSAMMGAWYAPLAAQEASVRGRAVIQGVVFDSIAGMPLAGAEVQLVPRAGGNAPRTAVSDGVGRFRIEAATRGDYLLGFYHPVLEMLGLDGATLAVTVGDDAVTRVSLSVPSSVTVRRLRCGPDTAQASLGMMAGRVRLAAERRERSPVTIAAEWGALQFDDGKLGLVTMRADGAVDGSGNYQICGIPLDAPVTVRVGAEGAHTVVGSVDMPAAGFVRRDFVLADTSAQHGALAVSGRVTRKDGVPVAAGRATIAALERTVPVTNGQFTFSGLPEGTWRVDVQAMGLDPNSALVTAAPDAPMADAIVMSEFPQPLDAVMVVGTVKRAGGILEDVLRRSRTASGTVFFEGAPALKSALDVADVMKEARGFRWYDATHVRGRAPFGMKCDGLAVYLNGQRIGFNSDGLEALRNAARPADVLAIETFPDAMFMPVQWREGRACSAMVVWTKY